MAPSSWREWEWGGMEPGVIPPMSAWWPRLATKKTGLGSFSQKTWKEQQSLRKGAGKQNGGGGEGAAGQRQVPPRPTSP